MQHSNGLSKRQGEGNGKNEEEFPIEVGIESRRNVTPPLEE